MTDILRSAMKVIIVTSSLMKDMNSKTDMYRANAIRVLCRITDGTLLTQIERYLKQAIVDKNPVVASAALVSGIHLLQVRLNLTQEMPYVDLYCNILSNTSDLLNRQIQRL